MLWVIGIVFGLPALLFFILYIAPSKKIEEKNDENKTESKEKIKKDNKDEDFKYRFCPHCGNRIYFK